MKKVLPLIVISLLFFSLVSAQEVKRGKVISKDDDKRVVTINLGAKDGVTMGSAFVLYDEEDRELSCILAAEVTDDTFTTDLIPIEAYAKIKLGFKADELGSGCRIEGAVIKYIPEGYFGMGDNEKENEMPVHGVKLNAFYIDKFEVTNEEYKAFVDYTRREVPYIDLKEAEPYNWENGTFQKGKANHPVVLVTHDDAEDYCRFVGKRLPTEAEWEKAARGTGLRIWPWGNLWDEKRLNSKDGGRDGTRIIGSFPDDLSPYDVVDMAGNVSEWTASEYKPYVNNYNKDENYNKGFMVIRGGSWRSEKVDTRAAARGYADPNTRSIYTGFRCVKDIEE